MALDSLLLDSRIFVAMRIVNVLKPFFPPELGVVVRGAALLTCLASCGANLSLHSTGQQHIAVIRRPAIKLTHSVCREP
jgi:hypothetical protein